MINTSNVLFCTGRLTKNVELHTKGSTTVGRFTIAVNRIGSTKQGGNQPTADFISWTVFGKTAENLANNCGKGSLIQVAGGVQNNNYQDKEGWLSPSPILIVRSLQLSSRHQTDMRRSRMRHHLSMPLRILISRRRPSSIRTQDMHRRTRTCRHRTDMVLREEIPISSVN